MAKELVEEKLEMTRITEHLEGQVFELKNKVICKKEKKKNFKVFKIWKKCGKQLHLMCLLIKSLVSKVCMCSFIFISATVPLIDFKSRRHSNTAGGRAAQADEGPSVCHISPEGG